MMNYVYLAIAIAAEVVGTSALKASENFTRLWPSLLVVLGYGCAFYFLTLVLNTIPVGIAYAIWSGLGIVLVTAAAAVLYRQVPDGPAIAGMALIVAGVVVINLFSTSAGH
jgi:small multidrug resistance pump